MFSFGLAPLSGASPYVYMVEFLTVLLFFVAAVLHSSLGFGGGSSYTAILSMTLTNQIAIRSNSLICNSLVSLMNLIIHAKNQETHWKQALLYTLPAVPMAYWGSTMRVENKVYFMILGSALVLISILQFKKPIFMLRTNLVLLVSAGIGFLSGFVGIGGGVLLAPFLMHRNNPSESTFVTSFYIFFNSIFGLIGLYHHQSIESVHVGLLVGVVLGSLLGNFIGFLRPYRQSLFGLISVFLIVIGTLLIWRGGFGDFFS